MLNKPQHLLAPPFPYKTIEALFAVADAVVVAVDVATVVVVNVVFVVIANLNHKTSTKPRRRPNNFWQLVVVSPLCRSLSRCR